MAVSTTPRARLGRPPAVDSSDTRLRILETAREVFADSGYDGATNRDIATRAGITPAALYHYFASKFDLYIAVLDDAGETVHQWLLESVLGHDSFASAFGAILDEALRLSAEHSSMPAFLGTVRVDARRHPDIAAALIARGDDFAEIFSELINLGVATGEIPRERRAEMTVFVYTALFGLTDVLGGQREAQSMVVDAFKASVAGRLVQTPDEGVSRP